MSSEKPSWAKTNVSWDIRKVIWQRWSMGDTVKGTIDFFQLHRDKHPNAPLDRNTTASVRNELVGLPVELLQKLLEEMPEIKTFLMEQRSDFKDKIESSQQPQSQLGSPTHITVIPKRKIKNTRIETKIVDGKPETTIIRELY